MEFGSRSRWISSAAQINFHAVDISRRRRVLENSRETKQADKQINKQSLFVLSASSRARRQAVHSLDRGALKETLLIVYYVWNGCAANFWHLLCCILDHLFLGECKDENKRFARVVMQSLSLFQRDVAQFCTGGHGGEESNSR